MKISHSHLPRYLFSGGLAYLVEMASLALLRSVVGLSSVGAVAISFWIGFVTAFILQKIITFRNYEVAAHRLVKQIGSYAALTAVNYAFTLLVVRALSTTVSVFVLRTATIVVITCWNFVVYQHLFKKQDAVVN